MKIITPLDENKDVDYANSYTFFLAGGCTTNWRDEFIQKISEICKIENIVFFNPMCDSKKIKLRDLLLWEKIHILKCDTLVFNFEGSDSPQPGSMFELGRYALNKCEYGNTLVNIDKGYKLKREARFHIEMMNDSDLMSHGIELFDSELDKMINRCVKLIEDNT